jgi:hypothetical protein
MQVTKQQQQEALEILRKRLKPGDTVYTKVTHRSKSGMMRLIRAFIVENNVPDDISYLVAKVLKWSYDDRGVKVHGAGMDMGFHLVHSLSRVLFEDNFICIGRNEDRNIWCPSNDHTNGDRDYTPHKHSDAGYALKQSWFQ